MAFDFSKLRGRIVEKFGTCANFAAAIGKSSTWVSVRLNNEVSWSGDEIHLVCAENVLDIEAVDIPVYFFTPQFHFSEQSGPQA